MNKNTVLIGICMIVIAIILGAFGAHGLKEHISAEKINSFEVGVRYQIYHGLGLLIIGLSADKFKFSLKPIKILLILGTVIFSGSIYLLSIQEMINFSVKFLGPVTPLGGVLLIISWIIFLVKVTRTKA